MEVGSRGRSFRKALNRKRIRRLSERTLRRIEDKAIEKKVRKVAEKAFEASGLQDLARFDIRYNPKKLNVWN